MRVVVRRSSHRDRFDVPRLPARIYVQFNFMQSVGSVIFLNWVKADLRCRCQVCPVSYLIMFQSDNANAGKQISE